MEQIYRRKRSGGVGGEGRRGNRSEYIGKRSVLQRAGVCILLFTAALLLKLSDNEQLLFARQSICYILTEQTDFGQMAENAKQWLAKKTEQRKAETDGEESLAVLRLPMETEICSGFGKRTEAKGEEFHYGIDFSGAVGDKIKCVSDGTAEEIGASEEYGNYILIRHNDRYSSFYAHCESILPAEGDEIKAGQVIATLGEGGNETETCLHFEIREGEISLDPSAFFERKPFGKS